MPVSVHALFFLHKLENDKITEDEGKNHKIINCFFYSLVENLQLKIGDSHLTDAENCKYQTVRSVKQYDNHPCFLALNQNVIKKKIVL